MNRPRKYFKLGLFTLLLAIAVLGTVFIFGAVGLNKKLRYHTFFEESVQGLEPGAPVKFRGVTIGHVDKISFAPDHQHVDVASDIDRDTAKEVDALPPGLRAQLASQGITGVKFLSIDLFDPSTHPAPDLPFDPPDRYIPATPSTLKGIENVAMRAIDRVPEIIDALLAIMARVDGLLANLERKDIAAEGVITLRHANEVLGAMQSTLTRIDRADLGARASGTLVELQGAATKLNGVLDRIDGEDGLLVTATQATKSLGAVAQGSRRTERNLDGALRDMSDAADAIRSLARAVERDPEMLLKGKAEGTGFR